MRAIIQRHNRLNRLTFSTIEFGLIALFVGAFAAYYSVHGQAELAIISWGIALNCVPVVVYGIRALAGGRVGGDGIGSFWNQQNRKRLKLENPHMLRDTLVLTLGTLLPFVTVTVVMYEIFASMIVRKE